MKLEDIGFYSMSDKRAKETSWTSELQRCEVIVTDRCNFRCQYCRGIAKDKRGDLTLEQGKEIVDIFAQGKLRNIRFSGGEPTIWSPLLDLVKYTRSFDFVEHIAISTNGSAELSFYKSLIDAGVNDFSISLDACCSATADTMAGINSRFDHIVGVIKGLSKLTYVTVGVVLDSRNIGELDRIIAFASTLGVGDIRIIPSAQSNNFLNVSVKTELPILKYRIANINNGRHVRGLRNQDCRKCHLVKDDMVILHGEHFPCVIYMREQGEPIGTVYGKTLEQIRKERKEWFDKTDTFENPICAKNCLDVCIDYNNKVKEGIALTEGEE
jgi:MoaA/NifB/PqqE/SkfB family radical SAM enzyme